jgi:hypothetical protein
MPTTINRQAAIVRVLIVIGGARALSPRASDANRPEHMPKCARDNTCDTLS